MKINSPYLFLTALSLLFFSCSSDDDTNTIVEPVEEVANYFPLVLENQWTYDNLQTDGTESVASNETLSVIGQQEMEGNATFTLASNSDTPAISFTGIISNSDVFKVDKKLLLTGNFTFAMDETDLPDLGLDFENLVLYDEEASQGEVMYSVEQNFDLPELDGITLSVTATIQSISLGTTPSVQVNDATYEDVLGSQVVVSMGVSATTIVPPLPIPITIEVVEFQEVVVATNYFANQVGMVESNTAISVEFNELVNQLPGDFNFENIQAQIEQKLASYQVTLEE